MLFAGTNGGCDARAELLPSGSEIMAYYPAGVFEGWNDINNNGVQDAGETEKKLYNLTQSTYDHRFFVDGAGTTSDAFIGSSWKAFFVGGLGAGGRSVYAIDASDRQLRH
jgi:type IV pilus assembly protein PilY1